MSQVNEFAALRDARDFGAQGDGVNGASAAIQACCDFLAQYGGSEGAACYLPPGRYLIDDTIVLPDGITICGAGDDTQIILGPDVATQSLTGFVVDDDVTAGFQNLRIVGPGTPGIFAVVFVNKGAGGDLVMSSVTVQNPSSATVVIAATARFVMEQYAEVAQDPYPLATGKTLTYSASSNIWVNEDWPRRMKGTVSPSAGAGVTAPEGSIYQRFLAASGQLWLKTGAGDTAWTQITAGGGGGIAIGDAITGGTAGRILFEGAGPVLADDAGFTYSPVTGQVVAITDATTNAATPILHLHHRSSGIPILGFGSAIHFDLDNSANTLADAGYLQFFWSTPTAGAEVAAAHIHLADGSGSVPAAAQFQFSGAGTMRAVALQATGLTATRIPFAGASGLLGDSANLTWSGTVLAIVGAQTLTTTTLPFTATITDAAAAGQIEVSRLRRVSTTNATAGAGVYQSFWTTNAVQTLREAGRHMALLRVTTDANEDSIQQFQTLTTGALTTSAFMHNSSLLGGIGGLGIGTISVTGTVTAQWTLLQSGSMFVYGNKVATVGGHSFTGTVNTSGARSFFVITPSANTAQTASTAIKGFDYQTYTKQWATGAGPAEQSEFVINAPTYAAVAASTFPITTTVLITGAPLDGANFTGTQGYALHVAANAKGGGILVDQFIDQVEMTAPAAPAANTGRTYCEDNGAGKTRYMIRFPTGAAVQIAIEP